jgi:hypothetical protein
MITCYLIEFSQVSFNSSLARPLSAVAVSRQADLKNAQVVLSNIVFCACNDCCFVEHELYFGAKFLKTAA